VEALARIATSPAAAGRTVDVGTGVLTTVSAVVQMIREIVGNPVDPEFGAVDDRAMEQIAAADVSTARKVIGEIPLTHLADGLRQTVQWYRHQFKST
jgi:UDP-glucose 4-epimerase